MRRQFLLLQRRFALNRRCSFSFFDSRSFIFSPHLDLGSARGSLPASPCGSTCRRCLLASGGSLPVLLSPPSRCSALDALAGCDSASSARSHGVGVLVFGVATVCRFASRRPIAALVPSLSSSSSRPALCQLAASPPVPCSLGLAADSLVCAAASSCCIGLFLALRSSLACAVEVWVGAARRGTFCY